MGNAEKADWAVTWLLKKDRWLRESYVNLIPTPQDGIYINGFRTAFLEAVREFCEIYKLLPRHLKLTLEDIWEQYSYYVLFIKIQSLQFLGQTKERLTSLKSTIFVANIVKYILSLW